jgi:hypothetical protein
MITTGFNALLNGSLLLLEGRNGTGTSASLGGKGIRGIDGYPPQIAQLFMGSIADGHGEQLDALMINPPLLLFPDDRPNLSSDCGREFEWSLDQ